MFAFSPTASGPRQLRHRNLKPACLCIVPLYASTGVARTRDRKGGAMAKALKALDNLRVLWKLKWWDLSMYAEYLFE